LVNIKPTLGNKDGAFSQLQNSLSPEIKTNVGLWSLLYPLQMALFSSLRKIDQTPPSELTNSSRRTGAPILIKST
jgi:hypothetical protein